MYGHTNTTFVARIVQPLNNEKTGYAPINEAKWEEKINRSDAIEMKRLVKISLENNTLFSSKKLFPTKDLTEFSSKYNAMISSWESEKNMERHLDTITSKKKHMGRL